MQIADQLENHIPFLRRYARALSGNQTTGDDLVELAIRKIISKRAEIEGTRSAKEQFFKALNDVPLTEVFDVMSSDQDDRLRLSIKALDTDLRKAVLLVVMEELSLEEAGFVLGITVPEVEALLSEAERQVSEQLSATLLIIEDEPLISAHLKQIVTGMGHRVVGIATTHSEAVEMAANLSPELVLADVQLADDSSGIEATDEIMALGKRPVVFITAFPERLLTSERAEPTFMVSKPFSNSTIQAVVSQALFAGNRLD